MNQRDASQEIAHDPHQLKLMVAAEKMGIEVEDLRALWRMDAVRYTYRNEAAIVFDGRSYPSLTAQADIICNDKNITKTIFQALGIPCPASKTFYLKHELVAEEWLKKELEEVFVEGKDFVCKPIFGTDGHAVGMNLRTIAVIQAHIHQFSRQYSAWLLETQVAGDDLRIQVIGGKIAAACIRKPAEVTGNGTATLAELVAAHNLKIQAQNPLNHLEIDAASLQLMHQQQIDLQSRIPEGQIVQLKYVSNMGQGGIAIDKTENLHPLYQQWVKELCKAIGIRTFAFDLISKNASADPGSHAQAIELNPRAQWLHHTFSEGKQHDIPRLILQDLFPSHNFA